MIQVSVILSTFAAPEWLEKVLWGYAAQTYRHFEVVVADDGSEPPTAKLVERMRRETGLTLEHIWHEHRGFRKCRIVNQAIAAASGEYLIFSDGDCIPRRDFIAQHVRFARPRQFLSGGVVRLPMNVSQRVTKDDILAGRAFRVATLRALGMPLTRKLRFLVAKPWLAWLLERLSTTRATFNGCNSSAWRDDVVRVNGLDERMHYGGLDRELGERLINAGVRHLPIRHQTTCLHLDHARSYKQPELIDANRRIREETRRQRRSWTPFGIYPAEATPWSDTSAREVAGQPDALILPFTRVDSSPANSQPLPRKRAA